MEYYRKTTTDDEDSKAIQSPSHLSFNPLYHQFSQQDVHFSPARPTATTNSRLPPPSPDSPWTLSPLRTPSPSLLHHCIASLHHQDSAINSIAASNGLLFTASDSRRIHVWRLPDCVHLGHLKTPSGEIRTVLSHGNHLFTSHKDRKIRVWNYAAADNFFRAKKIKTLPKNASFLKFSKTSTVRKHKDCVSCMAYYHAEGLLYTGSWDKTVKAWRVSDGRMVDSFVGHGDKVKGIVVKQDDGCVFTCSSDGSIKIWRRVYGQSSHTLTMTLKFQPSPVNAIALTSSLSSCFLYSGSSDGFINFWEKEKMSGRFNHGGFLQGHRFAVLCLVAIEKLIFSGSEDTTIRVWRREEGSCFHECLAVVDAHRGPVRCLAATLEVEKVVMGFLVYSGGLDQTLKVWRVKVLPDEKKVCLESDVKVKIGDEYEMSPVLSPSWVEKKLHVNHPFSLG